MKLESVYYHPKTPQFDILCTSLDWYHNSKFKKNVYHLDTKICDYKLHYYSKLYSMTSLHPLLCCYCGLAVKHKKSTITPFFQSINYTESKYLWSLNSTTKDLMEWYVHVLIGHCYIFAENAGRMCMLYEFVMKLPNKIYSYN